MGSGMGAHHSAKPETTVWLTPPHIIEALGGAGEPLASAARTSGPSGRDGSHVAAHGVRLPSPAPTIPHAA